MRQINVLLLLVWTCHAVRISTAADPGELGPIEVVIAEIDEIEVPAQERGLIRELQAGIGDVVEVDQPLGRVDDSAVRLDRDRIATELAIATHRWQNDLAVQLAEKALGVAEAELARAKQANAGVANTVSQTEVDRLQFGRDRAELELDQARLNRREAELTVEQKRNELSLAELALHRREIRSPATGLVVEVLRGAGEWVEPGETVVRILNTQRVRAEGMVSAQMVGADFAGRRVSVTVPGVAQPTRRLEGRIDFVDPRINVVSGECRISAEIENADGLLRPGHRTVMTIMAAVAEARHGAGKDPP
jgi:multidrug efflux pump subunit AcrA (membrane-fusion protein)